LEKFTLSGANVLSASLPSQRLMGEH